METRSGNASEVPIMTPEVASAVSEQRRQGRRRRQAMIAFSIVGGLAFIGGLSSPTDFLVALVSLAYAVYLYRGGSVVIWGSLKPRKRSLAWIYYAVITVFAVILGFSVHGVLAVALLTGAYSVYLFRGGRWILWIW